MKNSKRRIKAFFAAAIMMTCILVSNAIPSFAASTGLFTRFKTICTISDHSDCCSMQGMAVGSTYLYTVKKNASDTNAVLYRTHRKTGKTVLIKNGKNRTFSELGHANDMDVIGLTICNVRKSHLFVATNTPGENSLIRMTVKTSEKKAQIVAKYLLKYKQKEIKVSGVSIVQERKNDIVLLLKSSHNFYRAVVPRNDASAFGSKERSKEINVSFWFSIDLKKASFSEKPSDFSQYDYQGCGYHDGRVFVPLSGYNNDNDNTSVILVYPLPIPGTKKLANITSLTFRFCDGEQFEIESCGINSVTGEMFFNTNRHEGSGIHKVVGYKYGKISWK